MAKIDWHGDEVVAKTLAAARLAVDQTTGAAANRAKREHSFQNRTGTLEGSLQMRPAEHKAAGVEGEWGSFDVAYAAYVELGTENMPARPYLRPAADAEYPALAARIRAALASL